ncbi:NADP-dependent fatty aldehyde dehydrogenase (plasmid) [Pseudoalteromonas sp. THAF3]|uniref:aldehyde dehydrogenase (NADP(+)) n=1 Tax=Pseudoalteromonas sp. THAF3 TaxID=2587843 RepID=UPI001268C363|nr:aldehyde dehydrogenase (NADP(+)) [Pseudoalteromonas sp. THAF3]QFU06400.1 NADP-dependent fatty aldehyde dehydrogenase [Pseudoalteromonas sp. THAF3]
MENYAAGLSGLSFIAGQWQSEQQQVFHAFCPARNEDMATPFYNASLQDVESACASAERAFIAYRGTSYQQRSEFLHAIADEIEALGDELLNTTHLETNLPLARLQGERGRTMNQLRAFADALADNLAPLHLHYHDAGEPNRTPLPKPDTTLRFLPLGPVAVFGASNFPYAFSTLGGDTAAALAAGCPVIVKSHPAHPGTSELMTRAIAKAISRCQMPEGTFAMLQGTDHSIAHQLVSAKQIKAVGFTGSLTVAKALMSTIHSREEVIPFYGELGAINPQLILPQALASARTLGQQLCASLLMGHGQFCTSPGLWLVPTHGSDELIAAVREHIGDASSDTLLSPSIIDAYERDTKALVQCNGVQLLAQGHKSAPFHAQAQVFTCSAEGFINTPMLHQEVFGPAALIVRYDDEQQLMHLIDALEGQLTASIYGEQAQHQPLIERLSYKVGRLIYGQMPTGVEVCQSMNHGGPYPAATDVRSTSVGLEAMRRFLRPLCVQR